jgi:hypothetical protein
MNVNTKKEIHRCDKKKISNLSYHWAVVTIVEGRLYLSISNR